MSLTLEQLRELTARLEQARREAVPGSPHYCTAPLLDEQGRDYRLEPKPAAKRPVGHVYPDGKELVHAPDGGGKAIVVPLGVHGRSYLGIDPATGEVCCTACRHS